MKRVIFAGLAATSAMFANLINPSGPWQTVTTPATATGQTISSSVNTDGTSAAYWNNASGDSASVCENVGCFLTGASGLPNSPKLNNPVYLGNSDGGAAEDFSFSGVRASATLLGERAGYANNNWLGWYDTTLDATQLTASNVNSNWGIIYAGSDSASAVSNFSPTANFGLFFLSNFSSGAQTSAQIASAIQKSAYFTESSKNTGPNAGEQQFALFARSATAASIIPGDFWVGVEDVGLRQGSDADYNDMVLHLSVNTVANPEPSYFVLLSLGFGGLVWAQRRFRKES